MSDQRRDVVLHRVAVQLARETGRPVPVVLAQLHEAIDAGLLRVTRTGLQATIPDGADQ